MREILPDETIVTAGMGQIVQPTEDIAYGRAGKEFVRLTELLGVMGHEGGIDAAEGDGNVRDDVTNELDGVGDGGVPVCHHAGDDDGARMVLVHFRFQQIGEHMFGQAVASIGTGNMFQADGSVDDFVVILARTVGAGYGPVRQTGEGRVIAVQGIDIADFVSRLAQEGSQIEKA